MRIYWYWPFARPEETHLAYGTVRNGDLLDIAVIDRETAPPSGSTGGVRVERRLPDVDRRRVGRIRWLASRARTYSQRASIRRRDLIKGNYDLAHYHYLNRFTDWMGRPNCPWVLSVHDVVPHRPRLTRRVEHFLSARTYRWPDALIVHHRVLADQLVTEFSVPARRIHVVPHQVFPVEDFDRSLRPVGPPVVLFFGALRPNKGLDLLSSAIRSLDDSGIVFRIAGRGDATVEQQVSALARENPNVEAEIGFASLERKREMFREASVVVLPYESFSSQSGVLHDAYGHGRPVIVTDVGALGTTVREDGTGIVIEPGDSQGLGAAIRDLATSKRWHDYAAAAAATAESRTPDAIGRMIRSVYDLVST